MTSITILYFASIRTHLNIERETVPLPVAVTGTDTTTTTTISSLPHLIYRLHPSEKTKQILEGCIWSINEEMVDLEDEEDAMRVLRGGETVGVIPPVSGG